jgi:hypothetical protein
MVLTRCHSLHRHTWVYRRYISTIKQVDIFSLDYFQNTYLFLFIILLSPCLATITVSIDRQDPNEKGIFITPQRSFHLETMYGV